MPYIKQDKRSVLDPAINELRNALVELQVDDELNNMEGNLNYAITKLLSMVYTSPSYREINDAIGMLECCKLEYYRKVAAPYEAQKEIENGEVIQNSIQRELESLVGQNKE